MAEAQLWIIDGWMALGVCAAFEHPGKSLEGMDIARQAVAEEMMLLHPGVDVAVLFRSAPAKSPSDTLPRPPAATV
jgi:hypothetical protein